MTTAIITETVEVFAGDDGCWTADAPVDYAAFLRAETRVGRAGAAGMLFDLWTQDLLDHRDAAGWISGDHPEERLGRGLWLEIFASCDMPTTGTPLRVYRGVPVAEEADGFGMAWTTDFDTAAGFAHRYQERFRAETDVYAVSAAPAAVVADLRELNDRGEFEVLLDPAALGAAPVRL